MIFSKHILKDFLPLDHISTQQIYEKLNSIGLEVDSMQHLRAQEGVVVGKVLEVISHPNADKLRICRVDIGESILQIVCGASNVAQDQFVPVATIGTRMNEKLTIKSSRLRGELSEGMICSATELGFPKINDGILVLDSSIGTLELGKPLHDYPMFDDDVFEIDITPDRGDCLCLYGIARDLSASLDLPLQELQKGQFSDDKLGIGRLLHIKTSQHLKASLLYMIIQCKMTQLPLAKALILAHNDLLDPSPLVSLTRYATLITGTTFTLYSYDFCLSLQTKQDTKVTIEVKPDEYGVESVFAQNHLLSRIGIQQNTREPSHDCSQEYEGIWIIEASYIPPEYLIKQTAQAKHINKDQALYYRTSRGSNPHLNESNQFLLSILHDVGINSYSGSYEIFQNYPQITITISIQQINNLIGKNITTSQIVSILKRLDFKADITTDDNLLIIPPLFRHDIHNKQDIAEEIVRIIGIDSITSKPTILHEHKRIDHNHERFFFERNLAKKAVDVGFNETIHFIFTQKSRLQDLGFQTIEEKCDLANPIVESMDTLRPSLLLSLLDSLSINLKNGKRKISLFEIGSVFDMDRTEKRSIAFVANHILEEAIYPHPKDQLMDIFEFAQKISQIIGHFSLESQDIQHPLAHPAQVASIIKDHKPIGMIATLHPALEAYFDVQKTFIAEIDLEYLSPTIWQFIPFSRMQKSQKDLTVLIAKSIPFMQIRQTLMALNIPQIKDFYPLDVYHDEHIDPELISLTLRFSLQDPQKSLEEKEMNHIMQQILQTLATHFGATLR